jgi:hypothetical protein
MGVHSIIIFDRKGKTLFTKRYTKGGGQQDDEEQLSELRKLVFGMLFSLREMVGSLAPESDSKDAGTWTRNHFCPLKIRLIFLILSPALCCMSQHELTPLHRVTFGSHWSGNTTQLRNNKWFAIRHVHYHNVSCAKYFDSRRTQTYLHRAVD